MLSTRGGGCSAKKYIPMLGQQRKAPTISGMKFALPLPSLAHIWFQNPTLSGTFLENPTLCGTEICVCVLPLMGVPPPGLSNTSMWISLMMKA